LDFGAFASPEEELSDRAPQAAASRTETASNAKSMGILLMGGLTFLAAIGYVLHCERLS
jgi:hypothetical protein